MEILQTFGVEWTKLIAQVVTFSLLLVLLRFILYRPILRMLEERKQRIAEAMKHAEMVEDRLAKLESEQTAILKKAQLEADSLLKDAKALSKTMGDEIVATAKEEAHKLVVKAQAQAKAEMDKMRQELKGEVTQIAVTAAEKVVADMLTVDQKKKLVDEAKKEILY